MQTLTTISTQYDQKRSMRSHAPGSMSYWESDDDIMVEFMKLNRNAIFLILIYFVVSTEQLSPSLMQQCEKHFALSW